MLYPYVTEIVRAGNTTGSGALEQRDVAASAVRLSPSARNTSVRAEQDGS